MVIYKGEQFIVPVEVKIDNTTVAPEDIDGLRIQIGDRLCEWPDGELEYDSENAAWNYPLTENQSMTMYAGKRKAQISVKIGDAILNTDVFDIDVKDSIIKRRWTDDG